MIGATGSQPLLTSKLYQKMFAQVDSNADGAVSLDELVSIKVKAASDEDVPDLGDAFNALDRNADGKLQTGEFVPDKLFDNAALGAMLTAQEYRDSDPEARAAADRAAVEALFERADLNGDGLLNQGEIDAEKTLRRAETLDTGKLPDVMYLTPVKEYGNLAREDVIVGRMLPIDALKTIKIPSEAMERIKEALERNATDAGTKAGRSLDDLRAQVQGELDTKPLSTEMISRLFARLTADAFSREPQTLPVDQSA